MKLQHPSTTDPRYAWFHCPACDGKHAVNTGPNGWGWNGDRDRPTLTPSVLSTWKPAAEPGYQRKPGDPYAVCHSFVTDGRIQFLSDCTHALAGQTMHLPELVERDDE